MIVNRSIKIDDVSVQKNTVASTMFGANTLQSVNTTDGGVPFENYETAITLSGVTNLRFPGGTGEVLNNLLVGSTSDTLAPDLVAFLEWVSTKNAQGFDLGVTLVLPTKTHSTFEDVYNFANTLQTSFPGLVDAIEVGNEYSIGNDTQGEAEYGSAADHVIRALDSGFKAAGASGSSQPDILIQMAEIFGKGSDYRGSGQHLSANNDIIDQLSNQSKNAIDGVVNHYYYNKRHDGDDQFASDSLTSEIKSETWHLYNKIDAWNTAWSQETGRGELDIHFTEWNVQKLNFDQLGLKGAGTLLKQFDYMIDMGVDAAQIWPIQHKTSNTIVGNNAGDAQLSPAGTLFSMMSYSLQPNTGGQMRRVDFGDLYVPYGLEMMAYQNAYKTVVYVSSRAQETTNLKMDLRGFGSVLNMEAIILGYDRETSDGLSDMADNAGTNRVSKRSIDKDEYNNLKQLGFFDESNPNHITISTSSSGKTTYKTYLPEYDDIIAQKWGATEFEDFYFATETDVAGDLEFLSDSELGSIADFGVTLDPYEVVQITLNHRDDPNAGAAFSDGNSQADTETNTPTGVVITGDLKLESTQFAGVDQSNQELWVTQVVQATKSTGASNDNLVGTNGDDRLNAGAGNDTLTGGAGNDIFIFNDANAGEVDRVSDFEIGQDTLVLADVPVGTNLGQLRDFYVDQTWLGAAINYNDYTIILDGVNAADLSMSDFIFI